MTISVADPPPRSPAVPSRAPHRDAYKPAAPPAIAVTLQVTLCQDVPDPAAALRELVEHIATMTGVAVAAPTPRDGARPIDAGRACAGTIRLDARSRTVARHGAQIALCRREFDLLLFLAEHPGQVFTHGQLLNAVWGDTFTGPRTVDVHIRRLRHKLGTRRPLITTVRGIGYRLATAAPHTPVSGSTAAMEKVAKKRSSPGTFVAGEAGERPPALPSAATRNPNDRRVILGRHDFMAFPPS